MRYLVHHVCYRGNINGTYKMTQNMQNEFSPVTNRERQRKQNFNSPCEKKAKVKNMILLRT